MAKPIPHLRALQAFDASATAQNLSRAAEAMGLTHGAVSRQIKQLEEYVGVPLFHRHPGGVEKTEAGEQLHLATRQAFLALQSGLRSVKRTHDRHAVTISLSASLATKWLVPRLPVFRAKHPGIAMFLDTNDDIIDFEDSEVDVALRFGVPGWGNLYHELVSDEELIVVASPKLIPKTKAPLTPSEIARLPLLHDLFNPAWGDWADLVGFDPSEIGSQEMMFTDTAVLIAAAIDGQGVALARRLLVEDDLATGRVIRLDQSVVSTDRSLYFVCRQGDQDRAAIRSFRKWLMEVSLGR